jgi:meiosis-specific protein HOP1
MRATTELLRRLLILTQALDALPASTFLTMRLYYYEDVTPLDYEPAAFRDGGDGPRLAFGTAVERIGVGRVLTK